MGQDPRCKISGSSPALAMQDDFATYMLFFHSDFYDLSCSLWPPLGIQCISEFVPLSVISRGRVHSISRKKDRERSVLNSTKEFLHMNNSDNSAR